MSFRFRLQAVRVAWAGSRTDSATDSRTRAGQGPAAAAPRTASGVAQRMRSGRRLAGLLTALVLGFSAWTLAPAPAAAQNDPVPNIRKVVEVWLQGRHKIDEITQTPLKNMYEVRIGTDLMYVDARAEYAFIEGQMIDLKANKNLTQARVDDLIRIDFNKDLPLQYAIKQVSGTGKRVLAVFEDPNCTYCKKLRTDLVKMKDLTLYTFAYAILAPDSETKARKAWCAKDQGSAWNEMMVQSRVPDNDGSCENPVGKIQALGRQLNVTGTPTMFFTNGKRVPGAISVQELEKLLTENG
jgi:thiol:disulfide interchange protein DsbC